MSLAEGSFSSDSGVIVATVVGGTDTNGGTETGFEQVFLEGVGLTAMDSDRCLHCLSRNLTLNLEAISFSSCCCSSQMIGITTWSTPTSGSSLEDEKNKEKMKKMEQMKKTGVQEVKSSPSGRLDFRRLLDQNKIYNLIHYSIAICTQSKSGFSTNYCSIVVFRYRPQGWIILGNQGLNERRRND